MQFEDIIYQKDKGVATLIINRPEVLNAFRTKTIEELSFALEDAGKDKQIGVIVMKGTGEKAFCVGGDIQEMKNFDYWSGKAFLTKFLNFLLLIRRVPKPVI